MKRFTIHISHELHSAIWTMFEGQSWWGSPGNLVTPAGCAPARAYGNEKAGYHI
jgi:hypothetical protein